MWKKIAIRGLIGLAVLIALFLGLVALQPSHFAVERSAKMSAPPSTVFAQVNDFHKWDAWSPWVKVDPAAKTSFAGPEAGKGAIFRWAGNQDVGEGSMTIVDSRPDELIDIKLEFLKPMAGTSDVRFTFRPDGDDTLVTWRMSGENSFLGRIVCLFMNMDEMIGGKYEEGLAKMKEIAESEAHAADTTPTNEGTEEVQESQ